MVLLSFRICLLILYVYIPKRADYYYYYKLLQHLVLCVCVSVSQHLTFGASVCLENAVTYSTDNEVEKFVRISLKMFRLCSMASFVYHGSVYIFTTCL